MAGVKGRSGGARAGAGRKPKQPAVTGGTDAKVFLEQVIAGLIEASPAQIRAAQALLPFQHQRLGEGGKKDEKADKAKKAATGRFASATPPKLVASGGKKL